MNIDKIFDFVVAASKKEVEDKWSKIEEERKKNVYSPSAFKVWREASTLVDPCKKCASHHREREKHYTLALEVAEKELREKGVSVEVYDQTVGAYNYNMAQCMSSGAMTGSTTQNFQPRVDQKLLDIVKMNKSKMLDHRSKAEAYERYGRAFSLAEDGQKIELSIEDISYFRLEK